MADMRDGPHRTLPLPPHWKRVAERFDNENYSAKAACDTLCEAVFRDWLSDGTPAFLRILLPILERQQPDMHRPLAAQLEELRPQADGYRIRAELLERASDFVMAPWRRDDWTAAVRGVLCRRIASRCNQIVEHCRRQATPARVRRIESKLNGPNVARAMQELASDLATGGSPTVAAPLKRDGLEDGVPL